MADWSIAEDMAKDPALKDAIDVVGAHYPCGGDGALGRSPRARLISNCSSCRCKGCNGKRHRSRSHN